MDRIFPPEYYACTTSNYRTKRTSRWFCNKPLSPDQYTEASSSTLCSNLVEKRIVSDNTHSSEDDPFHASDDSDDSLYIPSDEEYEPPQTNKNTTASSQVRTRLRSQATYVIKSNSTIVSTESVGDNATTKLSKNYFLETMQNKDNNLIIRNETLSHPKDKPTESVIPSDNNKQCFDNSEIERSSSKKLYKRKPDFCYFCEIEILNFARHMTRNHSTEVEVSEILSKSVKSKERKKLLDKLRKKGNYLRNAHESFKPVRQSYLQSTNVLPCDNCLGFYSSKLLYRHRKQCAANIENSAQIAGQNKLVAHLKVDEQLKREVFPHMRADKVSLEAKKDKLICAFAARYLKSHRDKHFINVTSRKMRELAKILIEVKKNETSISNMFEALQPQHFDLLVNATKVVAKYNVEQNVYGAPTFAMNIATSLKQCCEIAITLVLKKQYATVSSAEAEASLKTMIHLFTSNWRFEVSSLAANNLNLNKWNKVTIIPLASDLKLLRQYLMKVATDALQKLAQNENDVSSYNYLMESTFCRVLLLNRKRPGELQRMLLYTYVNCNSGQQSYEEFNSAISSTEQLLLKKLKRVVIRGKRGRGVPVLFSSDVQKHIKTLIEIRLNFVPKENVYLFGKPNLVTPISGHKVLSKYAKLCGAKNPSAITATRLRKHLATLSQLFTLNENEIEQLATFMGHTPGVHKSSYRLPDDIYQTAKISKLLLLMEQGQASRFKGKSLDDINLDMEEDLLNLACSSDESDAEVDDGKILECSAIRPVASVENLPSSSKLTGIQKNRKKRELIPWTNEQKRIVKTYFKNNIKNKKPPKRHECEQLKEQHSELLKNKDWLKIKVFIQNQYTKKYVSDDD